jgi:hypothetical protein
MWNDLKSPQTHLNYLQVQNRKRHAKRNNNQGEHITAGVVYAMGKLAF